MTEGVLEATKRLIEAESPGAVVTVIKGPEIGSKAVYDAEGNVLAGGLPGSIGDDVTADVVPLIGRERSLTLSYGEREVFFEVLSPPPQLFVFGAVHIAQELVDHASLLGFRTIVADPRPAFVTSDRFPSADELRVGWPDDVCDAESLDHRTFVVVLTHDRRFEDPLWPIALSSHARYIGAMGSAKTTLKRRQRLLEAGFNEFDIARIHGPIGLDIGGRSAGETAIAILAEMIAVRYESSRPLQVVGRPVRV